MPEGIDALAKGIGKAVETVPELYEDGFKPAVKESGKSFSLIPRAINAALEPLQVWILKKEYNIEKTKKLLEEELKNIPPDKIVPPEPYVAVPAMQAISYSMDSEELRSMYASLLAKSMNEDTKEKVHPSFVDIIKQMSPNDANIFKVIMESDVTPLISLYILLYNGGGEACFIKNLSWIDKYDPTIVRLSFDNLCRLGLIDIPSMQGYIYDGYYDHIRKTNAYIEAKRELEYLDKGQVKEKKLYIEKSALAKSFYEVCMAK